MSKRTRRLLAILAIVFLLVVVAALAIRPPPLAAGLESASSAPAPRLEGTAAARPLRVLVIGASRGIGLATAELAATRGHLVTAMSRSAAPGGAASNPRTIRGDILDPAAVTAAVADVDVVVIAISAAPSRDAVEVFSQGMKHVLAALASRPEAVVISVTGIGAGDSRGHGGFGYDRILQPLLLKQVYLDKDREEALLTASPVRFTIVRPGFLTDDTEAVPYVVVSRPGELRCGSISRVQVAQFIVATIEQGLYPRQAVLLTR